MQLCIDDTVADNIIQNVERYYMQGIIVKLRVLLNSAQNDG